MKSSIRFITLNSVYLIIILFSNPLLSADESTETAIIDLNAIDTSAQACDNFYRFACGKWLDETVIPGDKSSYYRQSGDLQDKIERQLNLILESYAQGQYTPAVKNAEKLGALYKSCMQASSTIENQSQIVIKNQIENINRIADIDDFTRVLAEQHLIGVNSFFNLYAYADFNDSSKNIGFFDQGGLSLPEKSYYFPTSERGKMILSKYQEHLSRFLYLSYKELNLSITTEQAKHYSQWIMYLEKSLAHASLSLEDSQDSTKLNHVMSLDSFKNLTPSMNWNSYFKILHLKKDNIKKVNITVPPFYKQFERLLKKANEKPYYLQILKVYLQWKYLLSSNLWFSTKVHDEYFDFWGKILQGKKEQKPRWKTCTYFVADSMNDALAEAYVGLYPSQQILDKTQLMINQIKMAFQENLETLTWIDPPTKSAALIKLEAIKSKLGYPQHWKSYEQLSVNASNAFNNFLNAQTFSVREDLDKIGKPIDQSLWAMDAWEVNAYYDPSLNEFVFPLGELLPPILDLTASDGANFGAIGATIGHELTHGYDADGSQFDEKGNLKNWWTESVRKNFERKSQCFMDQADQYEILPQVFVNGKQTINENLADVGGLKLAFLAYKRLAALRGPYPPVGLFNEDQQFFLSYAQSWCEKLSNEDLEEQIKSDTHPPAEFRVNAVLMNLPEFAQTFQCRENQNKLSPKNRCDLW